MITNISHQFHFPGLLRTIFMISMTTLLVLFSTCMVLAQSDEVPPPAQSQVTAIVGANLVLVSSEPIENGTLLFEQGKISYVGGATTIPPGAKVIQAQGKFVYPGLFEAHSHLGLTEITSVPATVDTTETGDINSNAKAIVAVNPDSELFPVTRAGGVLLAVSAPTGGLISGQSGVIQLDGWTFEQMALLPTAAMHMTWPGMRVGRRAAFANPNAAAESAQKTDERIRELREFFDSARSYLELRRDPKNKQPFDLRLEAMAELLNGKIPLVVRVDRLADIQAAVGFAAEQNVRLVILGGYDAPHCAELLKKHNVSVIVSAVYRLPQRPGDPLDHSYTLPKRLFDAGVGYCISCTDRSESWNTRNLPFEAATAVAYGLPAEEALKAITLYPAKIYGVDNRVGTLEVGKDATLFLSDGSPLDIRSNVQNVFIQGREISLSNKQTRLYQKYSEKYRQLKESK